MGTSRSTAELVGKIQTYSRSLPDANRQTVKTSAEVGKDIFTAGAVAAGLTPGAPFPREKRDGSAGTSKWSAYYTLKTIGTDPSAVIAYRGPLQFVFGPTKPHLIVPRASRARFGRARPKKGPTARQTEMAGVLFGFLAGGGGGGETITGVLSIGNAPGGRTGVGDPGIVGKAVTHPGTKARGSFDVVQRRAIEATRKTAEVTHSRALLAVFR